MRNFYRPCGTFSWYVAAPGAEVPVYFRASRWDAIISTSRVLANGSRVRSSSRAIHSSNGGIVGAAAGVLSQFFLLHLILIHKPQALHGPLFPRYPTAKHPFQKNRQQIFFDTQYPEEEQKHNGADTESNGLQQPERRGKKTEGSQQHNATQQERGPDSFHVRSCPTPGGCRAGRFAAGPAGRRAGRRRPRGGGRGTGSWIRNRTPAAARAR